MSTKQLAYELQPIQFNVRTNVRDPALAPFLERYQCVGCIHHNVVASCLVDLLFIWNVIDELKSYRTIVKLVSYVGISTLSRVLRAFTFAIPYLPWILVIPDMSTFSWYRLNLFFLSLSVLLTNNTCPTYSLPTATPPPPLHKPGTSRSRNSVPGSSCSDMPLTVTTTGRHVLYADIVTVISTRIPCIELPSSSLNIALVPLFLIDSLVTSLILSLLLMYLQRRRALYHLLKKSAKGWPGIADNLGFPSQDRTTFLCLREAPLIIFEYPGLLRQ